MKRNVLNQKIILSLKSFVCVIGKLYATGGVINKDKSTNRSEVIDVANHPGMIIALPPMQTARRGHASAAAGSLVFVFGGWTGLFESTSSCEFYDSRTNR